MPPLYGLAPDAPGRADSEDDRGGIGVNRCQPPLSRVVVELFELPGLGAETAFELPRDSELWPKRWNPLFELV